MFIKLLPMKTIRFIMVQLKIGKKEYEVIIPKEINV
tara:strand:+ start:285 stop:392 length:108 start_codon:yes stop_codon:yes gene_type:complete